MRRNLMAFAIASNTYEGMPRYPQPTVMGTFRALDYTGTCCFAFTGALTASTCGMNLLGSTVIGCCTALGGGTVRDILWGKCPAFWLDETEYMYMSMVFASLGFWFCYHFEPPQGLLDRILFWGDTFGLGAFAMIGAMYACRNGCSFVMALVCTMITCTGGGVIRDTLCRRPARILHSHLESYAETTVTGGAVYLVARHMGIALPVRAVIGAATVIGLRVLASTYNLKLPDATR